MEVIVLRACVKVSVADLLIATPLIVVFNKYVTVILLEFPIAVPLDAAVMYIPEEEVASTLVIVNPVADPDHLPNLLYSRENFELPDEKVNLGKISAIPPLAGHSALGSSPEPLTIDIELIVFMFCPVVTTPLTGVVVYDDLADIAISDSLHAPIVTPLLGQVVTLLDWAASVFDDE